MDVQVGIHDKAFQVGVGFDERHPFFWAQRKYSGCNSVCSCSCLGDYCNADRVLDGIPGIRIENVMKSLIIQHEKLLVISRGDDGAIVCRFKTGKVSGSGSGILNTHPPMPVAFFPPDHQIAATKDNEIVKLVSVPWSSAFGAMTWKST